MRKRIVSLGVLSALMFAVFPISVAWATCNSYATGATWMNNCYVGYGFDTAADYITGAQRILKAEGYYGGSIDGLWGSLSEGATKNFQAAHGLASDGIIGTNTWYQLRVQLVYCGLLGSYYYDRTATESCYGSFRQYDNGTTFPWYIKKLNGSWSTTFGVTGPH